jgi:hypothetical protein
MAKKRFTKQNDRVITESNIVRISKEPTGKIYYEIGNEVTVDVAEAVAIMMRIPLDDTSIWKKEVEFNLYEIEPQKSLYWLSGGDNEWITLQHYNQPWNKCYIEFQEEFGIIVMSILKKSKTFGDIRTGFVKYLNLPVLYDFAISQNLIR